MTADAAREMRAAFARDDEKSALKLVETLRSEAYGRKDLEALTALRPVAVEGKGSASERRQGAWERLVYAIDQNIAFVYRVHGVPLERTALKPVSQENARDEPSPRGAELASVVESLERALTQHDKRVGAASAQLKAVTQAWERRVATARKSEDEAGKDHKIFGGAFSAAGIGGVTLFETSVKTPEGMRQLTPDVKASVETAGNLMVTRRKTLTRSVVMGPFSKFAPKAVEHGKNELYLVIESPEWATVVSCMPSQGVQARKMAQSINVAAHQVDEVRARRNDKVAGAREARTAVEADRAQIETSAAALADVHADVGILETWLLQTRDGAANTPPRPEGSRVASPARQPGRRT